MKSEIVAGIVLIVVAFLLVLCDRNVRLQEAFTNWDTSVPEGRCGVDLPPCAFGKACVNGYCKPTQPPTLPFFSELPVKPSGYIK